MFRRIICKMARLRNFVMIALLFAPSLSSTDVDNGGQTTANNNFVQESIVRAHQELTTRLYKVLARQDTGNLLLSPWSVMSLLTVTYIVAGGRTANEIGDHLHINLLRRKEILAGFESMNDIFTNSDNTSSETLESWSGAFVGDKVHTRHRLQKVLKHNLNTYIDRLFSNNNNNSDDNNIVIDDSNNSIRGNGSTIARQEFREMLMRKTHGLIQSVLPSQRELGNSMSLWLFNVMYFQGTWQNPFNPHFTHPSAFLVDGIHPVPVPTMASKAMYPRSSYPDLGMRLLELPYGHENRFGLFVLLPDDPTGLPTLERKLKQFNLESILSEKHWVRQAKVYLPKFKFQTDVNLMDVMKKLGFKRMFSPKFADFSRMVEKEKRPQEQDGGHRKSPYVAQMVHKAVIEVSENGTTAAVASTLRLNSRRYSEYFRVKHPFMFVLRDKKMGINLFVGRVNDPRIL